MLALRENPFKMQKQDHAMKLHNKFHIDATRMCATVWTQGSKHTQPWEELSSLKYLSSKSFESDYLANLRLNDVPCAVTFSLVLEQCWSHPRWSESNLEPMQGVAWIDRRKRKPQVLPMQIIGESSNNNYHRITSHINAVSWLQSHSSKLLSHGLNI